MERLFTKELRRKTTAWILTIGILAAGMLHFGTGFAIAEQAPEKVYYGSSEAQSILANLNYSDVTGNIWSKEAIYQTGALGIVKGLGGGSRTFGRTVPLTKEEALAVVLRAAGREAEAYELGVFINNSRQTGSRKTDPLEVMHDGFLQLAANEGLISAQDLADAFSTDQGQLPSDSFRRKGPAQRQEMAYWLARALNIEPVRENVELLNYTDWRTIDPDKAPYMESILRKGIMNGSGGRINPRQSVTREQGAQIIKNAESLVLSALSYIKNQGIVEDIAATRDYTGETAKSGKNIILRNVNGKLSSILTNAAPGNVSGTKNENNGGAVSSQNGELVVYKDGILGNSSLLKKGDRLQFITDSEGIVKYVDVVSNVNSIRYVAAEVNSVDGDSLTINVSELFDMDYPDLDSISGDVSFTGASGANTTYRITANASVSVNGKVAALKDVTSDATAILTIDRNNIVKEIQCVDFGINAEARRIVRGIVQENNPDLGYITLYNEDGSGTGSENEIFLRTFNYVDQDRTEVLRNHKAASPDSIQSGDTAYIKLDDNGDIESISVVDNYTVRYAKVLSVLNYGIAAEYEDGTQQILYLDEDIPVVRDRSLVGINALREGDRVRLLLNETEKATDVKQITIESEEHYITNIYKGIITKIDNMSDRITVMGLKSFDKGNWKLTDRKGFTTLRLAESFRIYSGDKLLDLETANEFYFSNEAYLAVERGYGGEEKVVVLSYRDSQDTYVPVTSDSISDIVTGSGSFRLLRENKLVNYLPGSIIVKYGRLVSGNSLDADDLAYLELNRDYSSGDYYASVVKVDEPQNENALAVYRGRISHIADGTSFTVESFSQLTGIMWQYSNTPKTFNITLNTRILADDGLLNNRDFKGYGDESFLNRTVYIIADGVNAVLVSTAPYGTGVMMGTVYAAQADTFSLRDAVVYDSGAYIWKSVQNASFDVLPNSIVVKNGRTASKADIKTGDKVRVIKKDAAANGPGYIIFVE